MNRKYQTRRLFIEGYDYSVGLKNKEQSTDEEELTNEEESTDKKESIDLPDILH